MLSPSRFAINRRLGLILLLYLILAVSYSIVVPIGRGADEWAHYWYAQFIAEHGRLPVNVAERETAGYKSDWPPLYHIFVAALTAPIETAGPPTFKYRADNIRRQLVSAQGPEAILHTEDERFPWQQEILVWHLGRFLSIAFTAGTLLVTYFIALEVFAGGRVDEQSPEAKRAHLQSPNLPISQSPNRKSKIVNPKSLALLTVTLLAFNPRFLFTGMLFNYDSLTLLLSALFLRLTLRVANAYESRWHFWGLGAWAGLALVTKYLAAPLPLIILVLIIIRLRNTQYAIRTIAKPLLQATIPFLLILSPWLLYLILTFNEIETYGPIFGILAPLIRGDGSDRTVEGLFAWLSGGQAPPPAFIEKQSYTAWQIITELPTTFWGNPLVRPYPLNWFVVTMTLLTLLAGVGIVLAWRNASSGSSSRRTLFLLLLYSTLPLPFMLIRLFGARDALEAVQGRHILFLAGPAFAVLFVWGGGVISQRLFVISHSFMAVKITHYLLSAVLFSAALHQLIFMYQTYPALLPVQTTPYDEPLHQALPPITLPGGTRLIDYYIAAEDNHALSVVMMWEGGESPPPEDYQLELALLDQAGQTQISWLGYQTQARYPTRAWEAGDIVRDVGWLPLAGLPGGEYQVRWRLLGQDGEIVPWLEAGEYTLLDSFPHPEGLALWQNGQIVSSPPVLQERQTIQFTIHHSDLARQGFIMPHAPLVGPGGSVYPPLTTGPTWATFIIDPAWSPGAYFVAGQKDQPILRIAEQERNFVMPEIWQPTEADFEGKIKLLGYNLPTRRVQPGEGLPITLFWQGQEWLGEDFVIFSRLLDNQGLTWGGRDRLARENYSTLLWAPTEIVTDGFALEVAPDTPAGVYWLNVGWYREVEGQAQSLPLVNPDNGETTGETAITIGPLKVGGPPAKAIAGQADEPQQMLNTLFGDQIRLLGVNLTQDNEVMGVTFFWEPLTNVATSYTLLVHIRNEAGEIVAQKDAPPLSGDYPTDLWDVGETIVDEIQIPLTQLPAGQYELVVGLYELSSGQRLTVAGSPDNTLRLSNFVIEN